MGSVQQQSDRLLDDGPGRVNRQEGEEVCAEGVCQLPERPLFGIPCKEIDDEGRDDDPNREDNISNDMDVRSFNIDILHFLLPFALLYFLVRSQTTGKGIVIN